MKAFVERVLTLNLIATTVVFYVAAKIYLLPRLDRLSPRSVLIPIRLLHSLRQLGLMFLTRGATYPGLPWQFAYPGRWAISLLWCWLICIFLLLRDRTQARTLVWIFNVFGTLDLIVAIILATIYGAPVFMDPLTGFPRFGFRHCWSRTM